MRKWMNRVLVIAGWAALAVGLAGLALHFVGWQWRPLVLLASAASYLMAGAVLGLVLLLLARGWRSAGVAAVVVGVVLWTVVPSFVPDGQAASGTPVRIMQSNLMLGEADSDFVVRAVREDRVDVLTVQELTDDAVRRLSASGIDELLPYHYLRPYLGASGTGIYSRYPLRDTKKYDEFFLNNVSAVMDHPQRGPITIFALHPAIPLDFDVWTVELRRIREILDGVDGPAIVGADLNATRDHAAFRALVSGRFAAAAEQAGAGLLRTYPADRRWGPVFGIDHILVAGGTTGELRVIGVPGSDHRALFAELWMSDR